jgi:hypothetical protein
MRTDGKNVLKDKDDACEECPAHGSFRL